MRKRQPCGGRIKPRAEADAGGKCGGKSTVQGERAAFIRQQNGRPVQRFAVRHEQFRIRLAVAVDI